MSTSIPSLLIALAFAVVLTARGEDPKVPDTQPAEAPRNPNHLVPIPAYDPNGYAQAVYKSLLGDERTVLWTIAKPSFSPEYAVILRHVEHYAKSNDPFNMKLESEKWVLEYVEAKKKIWRWKESGGELDIKVTHELKKKTVEVTREFAEEMNSAWASVLPQTRYPEANPADGYTDGVTYQFFCWPDFFGEIWTPNIGIPKQLTDLGHELGEVAKADAREREIHIRKCIALAATLKPLPAKPETKAGKGSHER